MLHIDEFINTMEKIADPSLMAEWDNCGIQLILEKKVIEKALIALEITNDVIDEAAEKGADIIITHHPLILSPVSIIDYNNINGNHIIKMIKAGISAYAAHTNFDEAEGGNNDYLAFLLNLENISKPVSWPTGRVGTFHEEIDFKDVCALVKDSLKINQIRTVGNPAAKIKKTGVCAGSGGDLIKAAVDEGYELFITGDIKYHEAMYAAEKGGCLIDAGHYGTEKFFVENLAEKLVAAAGEKIEVIKSKINIDPFHTDVNML